jgi:uncharacterized protein (DUF2062 family)
MSTETADRSLWALIKRHCGSPRTLVKTILQLEDTPHSIALGSAIGMWIALTPTPGIQMALVMATAFLMSPFCRWNRVAGLLMCYVSNPLTGVPILWTCYKVGSLFVGGDITFARLKELVTPSAEKPVWDVLKEICFDLGWPMLIGTLIVCTIAAVLTYPAVYWLVKTYQARRLSDRNLPTDPTAHVSNIPDISDAPLDPQPVPRTVDSNADRHATMVSV